MKLNWFKSNKKTILDEKKLNGKDFFKMVLILTNIASADGVVFNYVDDDEFEFFYDCNGFNITKAIQNDILSFDPYILSLNGDVYIITDAQFEFIKTRPEIKLIIDLYKTQTMLKQTNKEKVLLEIQNDWNNFIKK